MIHVGDCLQWLRSLPSNSVDSIVTDPPYGLGKEPDPRVVLSAWLNGEEYKPGGSGFMGRSWDAFVPSPVVWMECHRVLKPGGYLLSFAGTRTYDWIVMGVRLAGFEIRDMVGWIYGCLGEDTEILVDGEWHPYSNAIAGRLALCYDAERDVYQWQPIQELVEYDYDDTAFRIRGDRTDQIVSRNHRCLVERGGGYTFTLAETLERQARVPVLESVQDLLGALSMPNERAGDAQPVLQSGMCAASEAGANADVGAQRAGVRVSELRGNSMEAAGVDSCRASVLQPVMPCQDDQRPGPDRSQVRPNGVEVSRHGDGDGAQPSMEGRRHVLPQARELQADQVCPMPVGVSADGPQGWLCDGAPACCGAGNGPVPAALGSGASREPRPAGQPTGELSTVREQPGPQAVRGAGYTRSDLATVEPVHYRGKVWCVRVPSGAFVARRNGKVFVTGNSGFPKSLDVSKAIDGMMGAEREVVGSKLGQPGYSMTDGKGGLYGGGFGADGTGLGECSITAPATEAARQWSGFGTALKPSIEPVVMARKPLDGTVAENVLKWGTGAINVDGCRVGMTEEDRAKVNAASWNAGKLDRVGYGGFADDGSVKPMTAHTAGRWPANIIHDGSEEVLAVFPETGPASAGVRDPNGTMGYHGGAAGLPGVVSGHADDGGSAARFYYAAKASRTEREHGLHNLPRGIVDPTRELDSAGRDNPRTGAGRPGEGRANIHPTVKPVDLMRYLTRLVTPPGGLVVDPYAGSGTTGVAAIHEGFRFAGAEQDAAHALIAVTRIEQAVADEQEARTLATMQIPLF